jgi:hypothetical protein
MDQSIYPMHQDKSRAVAPTAPSLGGGRHETVEQPTTG